MKKSGSIIGLLVIVGSLVAVYLFFNKNLPPIFEQLIKDISQVFSGVSTYQLLAEIFIPVALFVLGVILENKYQIVNNITQKINLVFKQSVKDSVQSVSSQTSGRDSINALSSTVIKAPFIGPQNITYSPAPAVPKLASAEDALKPPGSSVSSQYHGRNTDYIIDCFERHSKKIKPPDSFKDNLVKAHKDLIEYQNADVSAASYFNIFKDVIGNLADQKVFCDRDGVSVAIAEVSNSFNKLEVFVSKSNKQISELNSLILTFERNVVALLAYI